MLVQARHNAFNSHTKPLRHRHLHQFSSSQQLHTVLQILAILHVSSYNNSRPGRLKTVHNFFYFAHSKT
jgi:hypothetical protein